MLRMDRSVALPRRLDTECKSNDEATHDATRQLGISLVSDTQFYFFYVRYFISGDTTVLTR